MKTLLVSIPLLIVLASPFSVVAQQPPLADTTESIQAKVKKLRNGKRFRVRYDKFKDYTWISVWFATGRGGLLGGQVGCKGVSPKDAPSCSYFFVVEFYSRGWRHLEEENQKLYAIIDGERLQIGLGEHDGNVSSGRYSVSVHEEIAFKLGADMFHKLATGKSVELKIGATEFQLKDEHQEAFRDLLSLTTP